MAASLPSSALRGANSPLPHCGIRAASLSAAWLSPTRGEFAPPSLRLDIYGGLGGRSGLRGANSPLPHCGKMTNERASGVPEPTRGEFAPPSLRPYQFCCASVGSGRLRGANSPLPHCGPGHRWMTTCDHRPTRGEFAPPSLRPNPSAAIPFGRIPTRGEFAPPFIAAFHYTMKSGSANRAEGETGRAA